MNKKVKSNHSRTNKQMLPMLLGIVVVILVAVIVFILNDKTDSTEGLPNYTDVKGSIVVDGLKYEKQPHLGSPDAKIKVIEFADFKCPACKNWTEKYLDTFVKDYVDTGKVELFFMNFAFLDRDSYLAASAGEAIYRQSNGSSGNISISCTPIKAMRAKYGPHRSSF